MNDLILLPATPLIPAENATADLVSMILAGLAPQSQQGYRKDLSALAEWLGLASVDAVVRKLLSLDRGAANALAAAWLADQLDRKLSPSTVRRRYGAFARVFKVGRKFSLTAVTPEAELPRTEAMRDCSGPGKRAWERMLNVAEMEAERDQPRGVRDVALILLAHDRGLRRGEIVGLDWPVDFSPDKPAVQVLGKGKREKVWLTISDRAASAIRHWVEIRGDHPGPLFHRLDPASKGEPARLTGHGFNDIVKALGRLSGIPRTVRAHGLRHQAITDVLDQGWSVRDTMQFSRHVNPKTVMTYDDRRTDVGGEIAKALGGERRPPRKKR